MATPAIARRLSTYVVATVTAVVTVLATAGIASAVTDTFTQPGDIQINDPRIVKTNAGVIGGFENDLVNGTAQSYPSTITVPPHDGVITNIEVTLNNLTHPFADDLNVLLVSPSGDQVALMSDISTGGVGPISVSDATFTFSDGAAAPIGAAIEDQAVYQPTDKAGANDTFPLPAPDATDDPDGARGTTLASLASNGAAGDWQLWVFDVGAFGPGTGFFGGWTLDIQTEPIGPKTANPYPSPNTVTGLPTRITDVNVELTGLSHSDSSDVDMLLVGPQGQRAKILSDVGGANAADNVTLTLDDEAAAALPETAALTNGTFRPADYVSASDPADVFPAPAPAVVDEGPALSVFDGTNPNGDWRLFVVDQFSPNDGTIVNGWKLIIDAVNPPAVPTLTAPANGSVDDDGIVTFRGNAQAGGLVSIFEGTTQVATTTATGAGAFEVSLAGVRDGDHSYTVGVTDSFGNLSPRTGAVSVRVDATPPVGTVSINSGAATTRTLTVGLTLAASDPAPGTGVARMRFSNDNRTFSAVEPFSAIKSWTLSAGQGTKTVFVQYADNAGKVSTVADNIVLDSVAPKVSRTGPAAGATGFRVGRNVTATFNEALNPSTVSRANVFLTRVSTGKKVAAKVSYNARTRTVTLNPARALARNAAYQVRVLTSVRDVAGNRLDQAAKRGLQAKTWRFVTR
jgi:subtilisin-like proprotein convertase family protein